MSKSTTNCSINKISSKPSATKRFDEKSFSYHERTNTSIFPEIKSLFIRKIDFIKEANASIETLTREIMTSFPNKKIEEEEVEENIFDELFELKADIIKKNLNLIKKMSSSSPDDEPKTRF